MKDSMFKYKMLTVAMIAIVFTPAMVLVDAILVRGILKNKNLLIDLLVILGISILVAIFVYNHQSKKREEDEYQIFNRRRRK